MFLLPLSPLMRTNFGSYNYGGAAAMWQLTLVQGHIREYVHAHVAYSRVHVTVHNEFSITSMHMYVLTMQIIFTPAYVFSNIIVGLERQRQT